MLNGIDYINNITNSFMKVVDYCEKYLVNIKVILHGKI